MTDQHPAVVFLRAVHQHAAVLAHQGLGEPYDRVPPVVDALAVRAARMNYTPVHPSALLRRIEAEEEILAEHAETKAAFDRAIADPDRVHPADAGIFIGKYNAFARAVEAIAKAWGWEAET